MFRRIWEYVKRCWASIKKWFVAVCEFFRHLMSFFKTPARMHKLLSDQRNLPVLVKACFEKEDYVELECLGIDTEQKIVVSCIYDKEMETVTDDIEVIRCDALDADAEATFKGKNLVVLQ